MVFLGEFDVGVGEGEVCVLKTFEFLFGFIDLATKFISFSLQLFPLLRGLYDVVGLGVFSFPVSRSV